MSHQQAAWQTTSIMSALAVLQVLDGGVSLARLGKRQGAGVPQLPDTSDSETEADGKEREAKVSNSAEEDSFCMCGEIASNTSRQISPLVGYRLHH